jgi:hypothetical protein
VELQIENACSYDGMFENIHLGYYGSGYANLNNTTGSSVMFFVDAGSAQALTLDYRYANASANSRDMQVSVNGVVQAQTLLFPSTGTWENWSDAVVTVNLSAGRNDITIVALTAEGGPNLDMVSFISPDVTLAVCVPPITLTPEDTDTPEDTETITPTITVTCDGCYVPSATPSPTLSTSHTPLATSTCTPTATPASGPWTLDIVLYPDPLTAGKDLHISVDTSRACSSISYKIYTVSFRLVRAGTETVNYSAGVNDFTVSAVNLGRLSNGTYYIVVEAGDSGKNHVKSARTAFLILK